MTHRFHCLKATVHNGIPHYDYCRSPTACAGFGYCRERNFDGSPMDERQVQRRRSESDVVYAEFEKKHGKRKPS